MPGREALCRLEALLGEALTAAEPQDVLQRASALGPEIAALIDGIDLGGVRVAALLVAQSRFQRLLHGSSRAGEWWRRDPRGFSEAFGRYHREIVPAALDPSAEASAFERWLAVADPGH